MSDKPDRWRVIDDNVPSPEHAQRVIDMRTKSHMWQEYEFRVSERLAQERLVSDRGTEEAMSVRVMKRLW